ncbi:3TM-type holin [Ferruginivarius sediminum]|uniref:Holin of 3TMs, for gene-transfer release n=1 Tax=Ferruginivarius sediminum TaxID=2661937 RepID=A0A369T5N0_9PROT|nr:3TM-type holin [Ferruginivarius sediminum]RDD60212.1 hypothetical protein DRB17_19225 [Ferruginivarius sediminum]
MDWKDVGDAVRKVAGTAAPLIGTALGGPAGGAVGGLLASALGVEAEPDKVQAAVQADPEAALKLRELETRHREKIESLHLEAETARQAQINKTMRAEVGSEDAYVRRWRPTFGYAVAVTWTVQMGGVTWAVVVNPQWAAEIITAMTSLSVIWSVALSVLGINVAKRSRDKEVLVGRKAEKGVVGKIVQRVLPKSGVSSIGDDTHME